MIQRFSRERYGYVIKKVLLILGTGAALLLTTRPDHFFRIIDSSKKEWRGITERQLRNAIRSLYRSKLADCRERPDGTVRMVLNEKGKKRQLEFQYDQMTIKKPNRWDGLWRIVAFDIPEHKKKARDALSFRLKTLGMIPFQKSIFIHPYHCKDEIDFLVELFDLRPFVRYIVAKEVDNELHLKRKFRLL